MNTYLKIAIGVAAVVVVAVVGVNLFIAAQQPGGPAAAASPSSGPSPSSLASPAPSAAVTSPSSGPLARGTLQAVLEGGPVSFTVSTPGWKAEAGSLTRDGDQFGGPSSAAIRFWATTPDNVYADPCAHTPLSPLPAATAAGLAAAVAKMPGIDVVAQPAPVTIDGHLGQYVAIRIRDDIACDPHDFYLWYDEESGGASGGWVWAGERGSLHRVWIVEVDDRSVWIDSESFKGATPELDLEIQQIVESVTFE